MKNYIHHEYNYAILIILAVIVFLFASGCTDIKYRCELLQPEIENMRTTYIEFINDNSIAGNAFKAHLLPDSIISMRNDTKWYHSYCRGRLNRILYPYRFSDD